MRILIVSEGKHEKRALPTLVRRQAAQELDHEWDRVSRDDIHVHRGRGDGFFKRAIRWMLEAQSRGFDALVLVIDHDGDDSRIGQLDQAQASELTAVGRALGVAVRTFDAWMLADEQALSQTLGHHVDRQPDPETIRDPKSTCEMLRGSSSTELSLSELYAALAEQADLAMVEARCPRGFAPFAGRVRNLGVAFIHRPAPG